MEPEDGRLPDPDCLEIIMDDKTNPTFTGERLSISLNEMKVILGQAIRDVEEKCLMVLNEAVKTGDAEKVNEAMCRGPLGLIAAVSSVLRDEYMKYFNSIPPGERTKQAQEIMDEMRREKN